MTTMPMDSLPDSHLRPLPWRRMAWVTWRQHRLTLAGVAALFGAPALYLLVRGLQLHHDYAAITTCQPAASSRCAAVAQEFSAAYAHGAIVTAGLLQVIPLLVGAFVGAPVLAREFETGTFRYAWTQGYGRTRWAIAKLAPLALAVTLAAAAFGALFSWYYQPIVNVGGDSDSSLLAATIFDMHPVALAAWTLFAFAIGALAGILTRRVVPALFATLTVWTLLAFLTGAYLRPHYQAPVVTTKAATPRSALVIDQGWTFHGRPASLDMLNHTLRAVDVQALTLQDFQPGPATPPTVGDPVRYLIRHGYMQRTSYQPTSRFWTWQLIEGCWLLALSLALIATTIGQVRRRAT
jgi:hypothetical protein